MVGVGNGNLSNVLEKVHLGHLLENFQREKITFGSNIQVIFLPNAMFRVELLKHDDTIKVRVSKL